LPQVRCPQCGAVNDTRAPDYPFCIGCQENLARCGYCQWFDDQAALCGRPEAAGAFEVSQEATPPCSYYGPRRDIQVRREGRLAIWVAMGLAAAVFALGYGLLRLVLPGQAPARPRGALELAVEADYRGATVGETYPVIAEIYNTSDVVVSDVRFEIGKEFLSQFEVEGITPAPVRVGQSGEWQVLFYPELNPREQRTIRLDLEPRKAGTFHLVAQLASSGGTYHGRADLPVVVKAPGEPAPSEGGKRQEDEAR